MKSITVMNNYVVLKRLLNKELDGSILCIVNKSNHKYVGKVKYFQHDNKYGISKGDIVFYDKFSSSNIVIFGKKYSCLKMSKIICKY
ncbi:hypothetical protein [Candidatus Vidania fulgoroideorum]